MTITINDKKIKIGEGATLHQAIEHEGIKPQGIATALNGTVINAVNRKETILKDGDTILIIKAFCGG